MTEEEEELKWKRRFVEGVIIYRETATEKDIERDREREREREREFAFFCVALRLNELNTA